MNNKGFTLISTMIAIAIMSVVMLVLMQLSQHAIIVSQTADTKNQLNTTVASATGLAVVESTCTEALTKVTQQATDSLQFDELVPGNRIGNLLINSIVFESRPVQTNLDGTKVYYGPLVLNASSTVQIYGSKKFSPKIIARVFITTDSRGVIISCSPGLPEVKKVPVQVQDDTDVKAGCSYIGGMMSNGECKLHTCDN